MTSAEKTITAARPCFKILGDSALTLELGNEITPGTSALVAELESRIRQERNQGRLTGVCETVPTYRSLTVLFDPLILPRTELQAILSSFLTNLSITQKKTRHWRIPVCYEKECAPDLDRVADRLRLSPDDVIRLHSQPQYIVYMIGFLPGFPYMGDLPAALELPRLVKPRVRVPQGAVAIAGKQTAIYPWQSPGGWHLIGSCPLPLFDIRASSPALLSQGDRVRFNAIDRQTFIALSHEFSSGAPDYSRFCTWGTE